MPSFKELNDTFHANGFLIIFNNDADSMTDAENYLINTVGFTATDHVDYIGNTSPDIWGPYGLQGYPTTVLLDRDGMIRMQNVGAIDGEPWHTQWETIIGQLVGN